jgi:hypothetical protein
MGVLEDLIYFSTDFNYQKIATEGTETVSAGAVTSYTTIKTVTHNLGKITTAKVWFDPNLGRRFPISTEQYTDDTTFVSPNNGIMIRALLTTNTLVIQANTAGSATNITLWWKVYYDS